MQKVNSMKIDISAYDEIIPKAINYFWDARAKAAAKQKKKGKSDQGNRAGVTSGKNMDVFVSMMRDIIIANGLKNADIHIDGRINLTLPGYYRPTKNWDLLVVSRGKLIAAIEFKSQVGPSFGNNFNNRVEEAVGNAVDINTAFREGAFGESSKPFVGYFFVLEDCEASSRPVKFSSPHFPAIKEFNNTCYAQMYEIFCRRLIQERWYDSAALLLTDRTQKEDGHYRTLSRMTDPRRFAGALAGKIVSLALE